MSSSFPQFSVDEIILRPGSQDLYFMIIQSSITLTTATPGAIILYIVLLTGFILYISLRCLERFREPFLRNSGTTFRKSTVYGKKIIPEPFP